MHPIENILNITMSELKEMADVDTIVGKPFVTPNGQTIVPISKISFGFVSGGGEYHASAKAEKEVAAKEYPFAGGSSAGISISPVAFMVSTGHIAVARRLIRQRLTEERRLLTGECSI